MNWQPYTFRFRQTFADGYRYLDRCGEFMIAAVEALDVMPGEIKPSGANIALPEFGIRASLDCNILEVVQERPVDEKKFVEVCAKLSELTQKHIGPLRIENSLFEIKLMVSMNSEKEAEQAMLKLRGDDIAPLARDFGMVAQSRRVDMTMGSGAQRLHLIVNPVAFETVRVHRHHPTLGATRTQARRAERLTAAADRVPNYAPYAVFLEVTLSEIEPPLLHEEKLFDLLLQKVEVSKKLFPL